MFSRLKKTAAFMWQSIKKSPYLGIKLTGLFSLILTGSILNIAAPFVLVRILSTGNLATEALSTAILMTGAFSLSWSLGRIIPILQNKLLTPLQLESSTAIAERIAKQVFALPLDHQLSTPTGEISQLITKIYYSVQNIIPSFFGKIVPIILESSIATGLLVYFYGPIGAFIPGMFVLYSGSTLIGAKKIEEAQKKQFTDGYQYYADYQASFSNYENAHYFNNVSKELVKFNKVAKKYEQSLNKTKQILENASLRQSLVISLTVLAATIFASYSIVTGGIDLTSFFMLSLYITQIGLSLDRFSSAINDIKTAAVDAEMIEEFLNKQSNVIELEDAVELNISPEAAKVEFKNVCFSYKNTSILNNVSFLINAGEKVAIVGISGAGKSTILRLLFRFYEIDSGTILVGNQDIKTLKIKSLKNVFGVVPQNPVLENKSLRDNICYANSNASEKAINMAIQKSGLSTFIEEQPDRYDELVGESGNKLSGGQKQRVAIARALLKDEAMIYFLDEATAALDPQTETEIQQNLDTTFEGYTTINVTHRLNTVVNADNIIFLENGTVAEQGTYKELMQKENGKFREQMLAYCKTLGINPNSINTTQINNDNAVQPLQDRVAQATKDWRKRKEYRYTEQNRESQFTINFLGSMDRETNNHISESTPLINGDSINRDRQNRSCQLI